MLARRNCFRQIEESHWKFRIALGKLMFFTGNAKKPQANWFFQRDSSICLRLFALDGEITHLPQAIECRLSDYFVCLRLFLVSRIERIYILKRWSVDDLILLSTWGFLSYHALARYIFWSYGASTTWIFCPPEALSRITYWRYTCFEAMKCRRIDSSVHLRLFLYHVLKGYMFWSDGVSTSWFFRPPEAFLISRIEGIRILKRWSVDELILPST